MILGFHTPHDRILFNFNPAICTRKLRLDNPERLQVPTSTGRATAHWTCIFVVEGCQLPSFAVFLTLQNGWGPDTDWQLP